MAVTSKIKLHHILLLLSLVLYTESVAKLNVPRVLLPYCVSVSVNFTLEVSEGGCYKWRSTRPEVARIHMVNPDPVRDCSSVAVVTSVSKQPNRQTSLVLAEDEASGLVFHCDVIVNVIHSLEIVRTTGELFLDDSPEVVAVVAKDFSGDTFSGLDGLIFEWSLITDRDGPDVIEANAVLRFQPFSKSKYDAPATINLLEDHGLQGYMVLIEGTTTGSAKISAKLRDPGYEHLRSEEITLVVVANLMLNPASDMYLLVRTNIHYKVELIRQGKAHEIILPSDQFFLEVLHPDIAVLDPLISNVTALNPGMTSIVLRDKNMNTKEQQRFPSANIYVVEADHIGISVRPHDNWLLELGKQYDMIVDVYDNKRNKIYSADNIRVDFSAPSKYFKQQYSTVNGTFNVVIPVLIGTTEVQGSLQSIIMENGHTYHFNPTISQSQRVEVCASVKVTPAILLLPWDPITKPTNSLNLKATGGGSTSYQWKSEHPDLISVNQNGMITTYNTGFTRIRASSLRNTNIFGTSQVFVSTVSDIEILPSPLEAEVDSILLLPLAMYADLQSEINCQNCSDKMAFTDCQKLSFKVEVHDLMKFEYKPDSNGPAKNGDECIRLAFKAKTVGSTRIDISYYNGKIELKTSVTVAAYKPFQASFIAKTVVLAIGTSLHLAFENGPSPWILQPELHFTKSKFANEDILSFTRINNDSCPNKLYLFEVKCSCIGETSVRVSVGNRKSSTLPMPALSFTDVLIRCAEPVYMELSPLINLPRNLRSSCDSNLKRIPINNFASIPITIVVKDDQAHIFQNISSFTFSWELSDDNLAEFPSNSHVEVQLSTTECIQSVAYNYQMLHTLQREGPLRVTASLTGYHPKLISNCKHSSHITKSLTSSVDLELVAEAAIIPSKVSIFNHPSSVMNFTITKGSGNFDVSPKTHRVANISYNESTRTIQVVPVTDGTFTLTATDLCLETQGTASAIVRVSGIKSIQVQMMNKVQLGQEIKATVRLLDPEGEPFPICQSTVIKPAPNSNIISVRAYSLNNESPQEAIFAVKGSELGHTTLTFQVIVQASSSGESRIVSSDPMPIQVFPPLRIMPCNLTLVPGDTFQLLTSGGPQPQTNIRYTIKDSQYGNVSAQGIITAKSVGYTVVIAQAVDVDWETRSTIMYSQDETNLYVVSLKSIKIHAPLTRLKSGAEMLVYPIGANELETPFSFGTANPALIYEWDSSDKDVIDIQTIYQTNGIHLKEENNFVVRLVAKRTGQVTLSLKVRLSQPFRLISDPNVLPLLGQSELTDKLQIQVFEGLELKNPKLKNGIILITPNTESRILTNRDTFTQMSYEVLQGNNVNADPCITVESEGKIRSGSQPCQATVLVTALEAFGINQTLAVLIQVKTVTYLVMSSSTIIRVKSGPLQEIPAGVTLQLNLYFYDNVGNKFSDTNQMIHFRQSRFDLLQITPSSKNTSFQVKAINAGQVVIKFWNPKNCHVETYINVVVKESITPPSSHVILGDVICFSSHVLSLEGNRGIWRTENSVVLQIDPITGLSVASSIGTATVYYEINSNLIMRTEVTVSKIESITIRHSFVKHFTNARPNKPLNIPVYLSNMQRPPFTKNIFGEHCLGNNSVTWTNKIPFVCELQFISSDIAIQAADIFHTEAIFDWSAGQYMCQITALPFTSNQDQLSIVTGKLQLICKVTAQGTQNELESPVVILPFISAFHLSVEELSLSSVHPVAQLPVKGTTDVLKHVEVISSDPNILEVKKERDGKSANINFYSIHLKKGCWPAGEVIHKIEVRCSLTNQVANVNVIVRIVDSGHCILAHTSTGWTGVFSLASDQYHGWLITILSVIGSGIALLLGYWALFGQGGMATHSANLNPFLSPQATRNYFIRPELSVSEAASTGHSRLWSDNLPGHASPSRSPTRSPRMTSLNRTTLYST